MFELLIVGAAALAAYQLFFGGSSDDAPPAAPPLVRHYDERFPTRPLHSHGNISSPRYDQRLPTRLHERISSEPPLSRYHEPRYPQFVDHSESEDDTPAEDIYASLRARAKQEGDLMSRCYKQSQDAYERRNHALAKALSEKGKRHQQKMDSLNAEASAVIFKENNQNKSACNIDLHGLYVKEAIAYSEKAIAEARRKGEPEVRLIVGQGTHSDRGIARLKPAIQNNMQKRGFRVWTDPKNSGVLVVRLDDSY